MISDKTYSSKEARPAAASAPTCGGDSLSQTAFPAFDCLFRQRALTDLNDASQARVKTANDLLKALPKFTSEELRNESLATLVAAVQRGYKLIKDFVEQSRDRIPPLAFHGNDNQGLHSITDEQRFNNRGPGMGYVAFVPCQAKDTGCFVNDLLNAAKVAVGYSERAEGYSGQGALMFRAEALDLSTEGTPRFRDSGMDDHLLSHDKHNKTYHTGHGEAVARCPGGFHARESLVQLSKDNYNEAFLGVLRWSDTSFAGGIVEDPQRRNLFQELAAHQLLATTFLKLGLGASPAHRYEPVLAMEERHPNLFHKQTLQSGVDRYTWPDGLQIEVSEAGIRRVEAPQVKSIRTDGIEF